MANMTTATGAVFIPEVWSRRIQEFTKSKLVLANLVDRHDDEITGEGDTIHIQFDTELVANDKVAGIPVSPQSPTDTTVPLLIDLHKESSFRVEDILAMQANINIKNTYTKSAGYAIAKAVDTSIAAQAALFSQSKGVFNTAITTDVVLDGIELLDQADVPEEDRSFVFDAGVKRDLLDISTYTSSDFIGGRPVETGKIAGMLYGVPTYMSNNVLKTGNNTSNMLFHKNAIAAAMQQSPRVQSDYQLEHLADLTVVDVIYGVTELRDAFGVEIRT